MSVRDRPLGYGLIDQAYANQATTDRELPMATGGWPEGSTPRAVECNHSFSRYGNWAQFFDQRTPLTPLFFGTLSSRTSVFSFTFDTGAGLLGTVQDDSSYVVVGYTVDLSLAVLASYGIDTWLFAATKDTHVYVHADGTVRFSAVTIGVLPSPTADELHLGTMLTNATDRVTWTSATDTPDMHVIRVSARQWEFTAPLVTRGITDFLAPNGSPIRRHKKQNASATARGYTLSDTITYEGVTGTTQFLQILPSGLVAAGSAITASVRLAATGSGSGTAHAVWHNFYSLSGGGYFPEGPVTALKESLGILTLMELLNSAGKLGVFVDVDGAEVANVELSYDIAICEP
jgi:hypothetical protein